MIPSDIFSAEEILSLRGISLKQLAIPHTPLIGLVEQSIYLLDLLVYTKKPFAYRTNGCGYK
jgi:hypothetical protein